jgi:SAM-dependent methyltransferase
MQTYDSTNYQDRLEHLGAQRHPDLSDMELSRIEKTVAMIPPDVRTVLDLGCGDGRILRRLPAHLMAVGVDFAVTSVSHLRTHAILASGDHLPFVNASFDLVLCCEVLEHLPDDMLQNTLRELQRVARRHILISVPYKENLRSNLTKCQKCDTVFHIWGHVRRFSNRRLASLLPELTVTDTAYVGRRDPYFCGVVLYLNQRFGNRWVEFDRTSMCPTCGNTAFTATPRTLITIAFGAVNLLTSRLTPVSARNWVLKLYTRS